MAKMIRAVEGTIAVGIHMITFPANEAIDVPDVPEVLEACRVAGAAIVHDKPLTPELAEAVKKADATPEEIKAAEAKAATHKAAK